MSNEPINQDWIEKLLTMPTVEDQSAFLCAAGLTSEMGLAHLLDEIEQLARRNPGQARQLAALCEQVATTQQASKIIPRALYLRAQAHAIHGELEEALHLIEAAHARFVALEMTLEALRTNVGRMNVLIQVGRFQEALDVAQRVGEQIEQVESLGADVSSELTLLSALISDSSGTAYGQMGRYEEAIRAYGRAEVIYTALDMSDRLAVVKSNRGLILRYLGHTSEALAAYKEAVRLESASDYAQGLMLINIGEAHLLLGRYAQSLDAFRQAAGLLAKVDAVSDQQSNLLHMADAYRMLNLYPEALTAYSEAEAGFQKANLIYERAMALWGIGSTLVSQNQLSQATAPLASAIELFTEAGNLPLRSGILLEQAAVKDAEGDRAAALELARTALELISDHELAGEQWSVSKVYAHLRLADLLLPDLESAEAHLAEANRLLSGLTLPHLRYRLHRRLGVIRFLQGQLDEAQRLLEAAINEIEQQRTMLTHEAMRTSFLHDKTAAYSALVQVHLARGQAAGANIDWKKSEIERAFHVVERAKSRALVENMLGAIQGEGDAPTNGEAGQQLHLLQADLSAVYSELLGNGGETTEIGNAAERMAKLNARALALEQEISLLRLQTPSGTALLPDRSTPLRLAQICETLPPHATLLSYYILDAEIVAFVVTAQSVQVVRSLTTVAQIEQLLQKLNAQWDRFRAGAGFVARHMAILERTANHILGEFYKVLVAPVQHLCAAPSEDDEEGSLPKLLIVPHGLLHQAPFHAFYDGVGHLLERFEISYAPSATVWHICQQQPARQMDAALIMGVPDHNIPAVELEVQEVARHFPSARVYLGDQATRNLLLHSASESGLLHLACHGLFRADNPLFSALKLHDGWLNAAELSQLDLRGARVVLSACESGRSHVLGGDELIGLARAALSARANTVVVSQWLVQDETGAHLMSNWYGYLQRGLSAAAALRLAQLDNKEVQPHPYYWAAFVVMGSG